jgi:hypothetical protein
MALGYISCLWRFGGRFNCCLFFFLAYASYIWLRGDEWNSCVAIRSLVIESYLRLAGLNLMQMHGATLYYALEI